jgi:hypothetical protein
MKKISTIAAAFAMALSFAASAAPADIDLGAGPGHYDLLGQNVGTADTSFFVTLEAGTYTFTSDVGSDASVLLDAWLSFSDDATFKKKHSNDIVKFDAVSGTGRHEWDLSSFTLTLDAPATIYLNVDTKKNKPFTGFLDIVAAPVPEPATSALLLAGLGMLGFVGRRRRG